MARGLTLYALRLKNIRRDAQAGFRVMKPQLSWVSLGTPMTSRRDLLIQAAALAGAALSPAAWTSAFAQARLADYPFALGVASGEPAPDGMVLWTRLCPKPDVLGGGMGSAPVNVGWEIAEDDSFRRIVSQGLVTAAPEAAHSVHAEVHGLQPDRDYWYRFSAGGHVSPAGRTRTTPDPAAGVRKLKIAYGSCQKFETGFWAAHRHLAAEHPDLVVFLGDYIYEGAATDRGVRRHPAAAATDLATYRLRYATYKADPALQAAHAAAPWMTIWDDHEVENDYGGDWDPVKTPRAAFLARRAAAYQAFYEHMPLRRTAQPVGPQMQLYRTLAWGRLAQLQFVDTRQYRPHPTCAAVADGKRIPPDCPERLDARRSLLGKRQEAWLNDQLRNSGARWNLLAQQYLMGPARGERGLVSNDGWDGYPQARRRLLETWRDAHVENPLVLGGDAHIFVAGDLALEPGGPPIASEFLGGSISSPGTDNASMARFVGANPNLKFGEGEHRGYGLVEIGRDRCEVTFRAVRDALVPDSPAYDLAKFVVEDGEAGLKHA
jgi:alkaline phosphatase D